MGLGAVASDLELDGMKEAAEAHIADPHSFIGRFAPLISCLCHHRWVIGNARIVHTLAFIK